MGGWQRRADGSDQPLWLICVTNQFGFREVEMQMEQVEKKKAMLPHLVFGIVISIFLLGMGMNANASWWNTTSWKEEVQLHRERGHDKATEHNRNTTHVG